MILKVFNPFKMILKSKRGVASVFVMVIFIASMVVLMAPQHLGLIQSSFRLSHMSHQTLSAIYLAEAGVDLAVWELNHGGADFLAGDGWTGSDPYTNTVTSFSTSGGDNVGDYSVVVANPASLNPTVTSTGSAPNATSPQATEVLEIILEAQTVGAGPTYSDFKIISWRET